MNGSDAVILWRMWTYKLAQILITLILVNTALCENNADEYMHSQICSNSVHDILYDLRFNLQVKEKNLREKFQDLGEYTINGIVETKQEVEKVYRAINAKNVYKVESDKNEDEVKTCSGEIVKVKNKINEMYDEMKTIKELYMNKYDYKNTEVIETMYQKLEVLSLKLKDYNDNTGYILGKHEMLLTNLTETVNLFRETLSNNNRDMNKVNLNNDMRITKYVNVWTSEENVCLKMTECKKIVDELNILSDVNKMSEIIRNIYRNRTKYDFSIILAIGHGVTNLNTRLVIYKTLFNELSNNFDIYNLIKLCEDVKRNLIEQTNIVGETKNNAIKLLDSMLSDIKNTTFRYMTDYLWHSSADYSNQTITHNVLLEEIYRIDKELCKSLFEAIVYQIYDSYRRDNEDQYKKMLSLLSYIAHYDNLDLRIVGFLAFYNRVTDKSGRTHCVLLFDILFFVKEIINMKIENDKAVRAKNIIKIDLIPQLAPCYRALLSSEHFCIKSIGYNRYISAVNSYNSSTSDNGTHTVFTTFNSIGDIPVGGEWTIKHEMGRGLLIYNYVLNKYLSTANFAIFKINPFLSFTDKKEDIQATLVWFIEPTDNYCYIHNVFDEYMYVRPEINSNATESEEFVSLVTEFCVSSDCTPSKWQFVKCPPPTLVN